MYPSTFDMALQRGQLLTHLQPIIELEKGLITALEVRVRWQVSTCQELRAAEVLRAADEADASRQLDQAVMDQIDGVLASLDDQRLSLPLAVNLTSATCTDEQAAATVDALLARTHAAPERLRLEFPFAAWLASQMRVEDAMRYLVAEGYRVVLDHLNSDDFQLGFGEHDESRCRWGVKLDQDLVARLPSDVQSADHVRAICEEARAQGLQVGAEGVASMEQLRFLREAGCHEGQGPLISRPRPLEALMTLLKKGRCW